MFDLRVSIDHINMARLNTLRAWARKNKASVHVTRYASDAYEGHVSIPYNWQRGKAADEALVAAARAAIAGK